MAPLIVPRDKEAPLVIQLARHCPMILDRPPIHRFNAIEPRASHPSVPPLFHCTARFLRRSLQPDTTEYDDK